VTSGKGAFVPANGELFEIRPRIFWTRLALPFRLNHVNIYILDDGDGWTVFDAGIGDAATQAVWERLLAGPLSGKPISRIICSHHHPDHVGIVGWLCRKTGAPLYMSETEYLLAQYYASNPHAIDGDAFRRLYLEHGVSAEETDGLLSRGHNYQRITTGLPDGFVGLEPGTVMAIGGRRFEVMTGGGHSSAQVMLLCREGWLLLAADQVLPRITPNIGVTALQAHGDPLGRYLASLDQIKRDVPNDVLALPGHDWPFENLHRRIDELISHHHERCDLIAAATRRQGAQTVDDLIPVLFPQVLDLHQRSFAFAETLSHVNYMLGSGRLTQEQSGPVARVVSALHNDCAG
jgi:glyoxylase-like metal-dependent hydrolase (beta-lactamase superfamily II)